MEEANSLGLVVKDKYDSQWNDGGILEDLGHLIKKLFGGDVVASQEGCQNVPGAINFHTIFRFEEKRQDRIDQEENQNVIYHHPDLFKLDARESHDQSRERHDEEDDANIERKHAGKGEKKEADQLG